LFCLDKFSDQNGGQEMNNYRMGAYAMIATGLLNWDYQRAQPHVALHSLAIILPGALLLGLTFLRPAQAFLRSRIGIVLSLVIGIAALSYSFINK